VTNVVRISSARWRKGSHEKTTTTSRTTSPTPDELVSIDRQGLLAAILLPDGCVRLYIEGRYLEDLVAAMSTAVQLAEYARELHAHNNK